MVIYGCLFHIRLTWFRHTSIITLFTNSGTMLFTKCGILKSLKVFNYASHSKYYVLNIMPSKKYNPTILYITPWQIFLYETVGTINIYIS